MWTRTGPSRTARRSPRLLAQLDHTLVTCARLGSDGQRKYRQVLTSNDKGNIAEAAVALEAIKLGIDVLKPVTEHCRYDLAFDLRTRILRVQCKWATLVGDIVRVYLT